LTDELTVTYFGPMEGNLYDRFIHAAKSHDAYHYFQVNSGCSIEHFGAKKVPGLMLTRPFEQSPVHYDGDETEHGILFWMEVLSIPKVVEFSKEYVNTIFAKGRTALVLFTDDPHAEYVRVFKEAAYFVSDYILFVICPI